MKVSTIIISYNRAGSLRRAIDSVLMQHTDFETEIIVVDDGSTDGSRDILREYYEQGKLSVLACGEHYGMMTAYRESFKRCSGDYICLCDADDYWTNPYRLHYQVAFMDANPGCPLCVTRVHVEQDGRWLPCEPDWRWEDTNLTYDKLLRGNAYIHAQSYMMRRSAFDKYCDFDMFARRFHVWDYPIVLELIRHGLFHRLPVYTAVYVKNTESATNTRSRSKRLRHILGNYKIRMHYILRYGCKWSTAGYLVYRFARDIVSIIMRRWTK